MIAFIFHDTRRRHLIWLALWIAVGCAFLAFLGFRTHVDLDGYALWHTTDDHMITQRVAYMMWTHGQPYFNPGEPVAASTSLFWPIILAPLYGVFTLEGVMPVVIALSTAMCCASFGLAAWVTRAPVMTLALGFFLFRGIQIFGASGVEQIPQMLCYTIACAALLHLSARRGRLSVPNLSLVMLALAFLLRPDAAPAMVPFLLAWALTDDRMRRVSTLGWMAAGLCVVALYLGLMWFFYGSLVPNTAHLKIAFGWDAVKSGLSYATAPWRAGPVPLIGVFLLILWRHLRPAERLIFASVFVQGLYVVAVGGDFFSGGRFLLMVMPIMLALGLSVLMRGLQSWQRPVVLPFVTVGLLVVPNYPLVKTMVEHRTMPYLSASGRVTLGASNLHLSMHLRDRLTPQDGSIGLHSLGHSYHLPEFHVVDFLGKAEPHIARLPPRNGRIGHNKYDYDYVYDTYDVAVSYVAHGWAQSAQDHFNGVRSPRVWEYHNLGPRAALERGYVWLSSDDLGLPGRAGLLVRPDLVERLMK